MLICLHYFAVLPETIDVVLSLEMISDLNLEKHDTDFRSYQQRIRTHEMNRLYVGDLQFLDERQAYVLDNEYLQIHLS